MKNKAFLLIISFFISSTALIQGSSFGQYTYNGSSEGYKLRLERRYESQIVQALIPIFESGKSVTIHNVKDAINKNFPNLIQELRLDEQRLNASCDISNSSLSTIKYSIQNILESRGIVFSWLNTSSLPMVTTMVLLPESPQITSESVTTKVLLPESPQVTSESDICLVEELLKKLNSHK